MRATTTMKKNWGAMRIALPACSVRMGLTDWKKVAADAWNAPSWREAVREYHRDRAGRRLIVEIEPEHKRLKRLMRPGVTLEQAYRELNDPRNRPTPKVTVEVVMVAARARGIAALKEPATAERLQRCDAAARAEINQRIEKLGLKPCLTTLLAKRSQM
jgi:hypothetical protein